MKQGDPVFRVSREKKTEKKEKGERREKKLHPKKKKDSQLTPLATAAHTALELSTTSCAVTLGLALRNAASSRGIT